jgi:hypothetical protein
MSNRAVTVILAAVLGACGWASGLQADQDVKQLFPGITYIFRTEMIPASPVPSPQPIPSPRPVRMHIVLVDLTAPEIHFKMTPPGENLPLPLFGSPGWPLNYPLFETVRESTLGFLNSSHAQVAIDSHFFAPFPVPNGSTQGAYAYLIGLAASRGNVYSGFEAPFQNYAIVTNSPALNIDSANRASIVHRDPSGDDKQVLEDVEL